jgi:hypothetical protein
MQDQSSELSSLQILKTEFASFTKHMSLQQSWETTLVVLY